jgi:putative ABC transport system permease protein
MDSAGLPQRRTAAGAWARSLSFNLPVRFLRGSYGRLAFSVLALALGVALVCAMDLVNRAVLRAFVEVIDTMAGRAALQVANGQGGIFPEEIADRIAAVPGVELAVPVVTASAFTVDGETELLTVYGVDVANDAAVRVYESRDAGGLAIDDPLEFLNQPDSIVVTRTFAERRNLGLDDALELETTAGRRRFTIRSVLEPRGLARVYGGRLVVMDLYSAEAAFTRPGFVNRVDVVVDRAASVEHVAEGIRGALPDGFSAAPPGQRRADLHKAMQSFQALLQGVALVGLIAAFLITFNRLATVFDARVWQLGVLRAVGMTRRTLWGELVKESLVIGAMGVAVGVPLGCGLGYLVLPVIASATALNYKLVDPDAGFDVQPISLLIAAALGCAAAVLAAILPAWRASRIALAQVIRSRGLEQPSAHGRLMWVARALIAAAAAAAIVLQTAYRSPTWGLLATALLAVAATLTARPLLVLLQPPLSALLVRVLPRTGRFAAGAVGGNSQRSGLTVATLAVGIGLVIWIWTVAQSFEQSVVSALGNAFKADLVLSSSHLVSGFDDEPISGSVVAEVGALSGVEQTVGERIRDWTYAGKAIAIDAFDPVYFDSSAFGRWELLGERIEGVWPAVTRGEAIIVSSSFTHNFAVRVGERVTLATPNGPLTVVIGGVTSAFASPNGTIEMSRQLFERYWNDASVTRVHVRLASGAESAVRERINAAFGQRYRLRMLSAGDLLTYWTDQVRSAFAGLHVIGAVVLVVILIGMADTLTASIVDRTRELGLARAVGMRRSDIASVVMAEALILGTVGLGLAVVLGLLEGWVWVNGTLPLLLGWILRLEIPYRLALLVSMLTLAGCLVSALVPARRAARLDPGTALRYE